MAFKYEIKKDGDQFVASVPEFASNGGPSKLTAKGSTEAEAWARLRDVARVYHGSDLELLK